MENKKTIIFKIDKSLYAKFMKRLALEPASTTVSGLLRQFISDYAYGNVKLGLIKKSKLYK